MLLSRNKLIQAILQGDTASLEQAMPVKFMECYQISGQEEYFNMDGTEIPLEKMNELRRSNAFLEVRTYLSHDEVP